MRRLATLTTLALTLPLTAALAAPLSKTDRAFIHRAAAGGMAEVQEGQLAATKADSADVKAFAQKMVDAHTQNNQALAQLVDSKGVKLPTTLPKKLTAELASLNGLSGAQFDTAYAQDQVKGHEAMEKVMQTEIDSGTDPDLKNFATQTLPVVQDHLKMAQGLHQ